MRRSRRNLRWAAGVISVLLAAELTARHGMGLGDPLLFDADPEMEYVYRPNQEVRRFSRSVRINEFSMRGPQVPASKEPPEAWRVLLLGDSIVFGTTLLDDEETIGVQLERLLARELAAPGRVLSASAGSWGPANVLAYVRRHGTFDADIVVVLLPSRDWWDRPKFDRKAGVDRDMPSEKPRSALAELLSRYVPRLWALASPDLPSASEPFEDAPLEATLTLARGRGARTLFALWPALDWTPIGADERGLESFREATRRAGAEFVDLRSELPGEAATRARLYLDGVHTSAEGARWIAQRIAGRVRPWIEDRAQRTPQR